MKTLKITFSNGNSVTYELHADGKIIVDYGHKRCALGAGSPRYNAIMSKFNSQSEASKV